MTVDQLFAGELTDEIKVLARRRLLEGGNPARRKDVPRGVIKLALLLIREINSLEHLSKEETAILMGVDRHTLAKMDTEKRFVHVVNH